MLASEIWKVELELDILSNICVDVYCSREDPPPTISTSSNLTKKKRSNTLYHYINLCGFTQTMLMRYFSFLMWYSERISFTKSGQK